MVELKDAPRRSLFERAKIESLKKIIEDTFKGRRFSFSERSDRIEIDYGMFGRKRMDVLYDERKICIYSSELLEPSAEIAFAFEKDGKGEYTIERYQDLNSDRFALHL